MRAQVRWRSNDALTNVLGAQAVSYSLLSAAVTTTVGALLFIWAAGSIRSDIQRASWFDQPAASSPPCFCYCFTQADVAAAGFAVGQTTWM